MMSLQFSEMVKYLSITVDAHEHNAFPKEAGSSEKYRIDIILYFMPFRKISLKSRANLIPENYSILHYTGFNPSSEFT